MSINIIKKKQIQQIQITHMAEVTHPVELQTEFLVFLHM